MIMNSTRKPLNLIKSPIFTNTPCKSTCLYNAPSMHTVEKSTLWTDAGVDQNLSGKSKPGFSRPCLCLSDTHHFWVIFVVFGGILERDLCFQWVECKFVIFVVFATRFTKNTVCQAFSQPDQLASKCKRASERKLQVVSPRCGADFRPTPNLRIP